MKIENRINRIKGLTGDKRPRILAFASGKGGVGKSVIAFNLAERLSQKARVLLIDGDFSTGNLHLLANVAPQHSWQQVVLGECRFGEALIRLNKNFDLLASTTLDQQFSLPDTKSLAYFMGKLQQTASAYDFVIIDTASGIMPQTNLTLHIADEVVLITTAELTAISDCYALYKVLVGNDKNIFASLLINQENKSEEVQYIYQKFCTIASQFLSRTPGFFGCLGTDKTITGAVASQQAVAIYNPQSLIAGEFSRIAGKLLDQRTAVAPQGVVSENVRPELESIN